MNCVALTPLVSLLRSFDTMMRRNLLLMVFLVLSAGLLPGITMAGEQPEQLPSGFVYVDTVVPDIRIELRYATAHNFVGERIDGYLQPRCILTREAAVALRQVQEELRPFGLGLKVFDAYRPQQAVDHFVRWARDLTATRTKGEFYPGVAKEKLFEEEYIADRSGHSRGSTVDLTIVSLPGDSGRELDMGTGFDFFGPESWPLYA